MARVLVIDDEEVVRRAIGLALSRAGHHVRLAEDGAVGLALLADHGADLVITDIIMPDMAGIETIAELRQHHPKLPVIAMSGGGRTANFQFLEVARHLGAVHTLRKPFDTSELLAAIAACVGAPGRGEAPT